MQSIVIGVDPGLSGAIAVLKNGIPVSVIDMPICKRKLNKRAYDVSKLKDFFSAYLHSGFDVKVGVESTRAFPSRGTNPQGNWHLGFAMGMFETIFSFLSISAVFIPPQTWQSYYQYRQALSGVDRFHRAKAVKAFSYEMVRKLFPESICLVSREKKRSKSSDSLYVYDGRCDALLIAKYCSLQYFGP